eukprot:TRINITY_DN1796_c0_g1_i1.p1 TRINITY_DN1796_c0_g1~~TRINITY_DN1796_c0_g1_i1.p1  ORF type:complete len:237 (-),score=67.53 TRINITY_DN1796_c0_g1_i1:180-890(-)
MSAKGKEKKDKEKEKAAKVSDKDAETVVLDYINKQNRPYNAQQIIDNLHGGVGKSQAPRILQALADKGLIAAKENGKQKIYWKKQEDEVVDASALNDLDRQVEKLQAEFEQVSGENKQFEVEVKSLTSQLTVEQVEAEIERLTQENAALEKKLEGLRNNTVKISDQDRKKAETRYSTMRSQWQKRKRIFKDIIGHLEEGSGKSSKELFQEFSVETDEDRGVSLGDDLLANSKKRKA